MKNNIVTKDDYLLYFGTNLDMEIPKGDNPNGRTERYIWRVEQYCKNILTKFKYQEINDDNIYYYKQGVMLMIYHSLRVGFVNLKGFTDEAFNAFRQGGFCNVPKVVL